MTLYRLPNEYRNILIPLAIILFGSMIFSFGNLFGNYARLFFAAGTIYLIYKYLAMIHTVEISIENTVRIKSFTREKHIPGKDIQKIEDYNFFVKVDHYNGHFSIICLFERYPNLKNNLKTLNSSIDFVEYEKVGEDSDKVFFTFIKIIMRLARWI